MPSQEDIDAQLRLLVIHRRNLALLLSQRAQIGSLNVPLHVYNGIDDERDKIRRIKETLRRWGVAVEDLPDDEEGVPSYSPSISDQPQPSIRKLPWSKDMMGIIGLVATIVACLAAVIVVPEVRQ